MYLAFSLKKLAAVLLIAGVLWATVWYTFTSSEQHFGNLRLPTAMLRYVKKELLTVVYSVRYAQVAGVGFVTGLFGFGDDSFVRTKIENAEAIPVLIYHALPKVSDGHNVAEDIFVEQMFALKRAGWETVTIEEFSAFIRGEQTIPARSILITFDDGARESYYPSDPVFEALGYNAVSFILPKFSVNGGSHYYLSEGEIESMIKSGRWEIGSHGQNAHEELRAVDAEGTRGAYLANRLYVEEEGRIETIDEYRARVSGDLSESQRNLERLFGVPVRVFAFPFGEFGHLTKHLESPTILREEAKRYYDFAFYQTWPGEGLSYNYPDENRDQFMIKRIEVSPVWSGKELLSILSRGFPKELPFSDSFTTNHGWFSNWGSYQITNGELRLDALPEETGMATVLDGTGHWTDYRFTATVHSLERTGVTLWARVEDNQDMASCNFGNGFTHVEDEIDGSRRVINGVRGPEFSIPSGEFTIAIEVEGRRVACFMNGQKIVETTFLNPLLNRGGVGIKVWDPVRGKSKVVVKDISVVPLTNKAP